MTNPFTTYQPPGVYVQQSASSVPLSIGVGPAVVGIVGPSVGYRSFTETVTLNGTTAVTLAQLGIDTTSVVVTRSNGSTSVSGDYVLTALPGVDGLTTTGHTADDPTTLARSNSTSINDGEAVTVTYNYTDGTFFQPVRVSTAQDAVAAFGAPLATDGTVLSPLTFAAKFAFDNGASEVVLCAVPGTATLVAASDLVTGYAALAAFPDVTLVVPLPVGIVDPGSAVTLVTNLKSAMESAANDQNYRIGILGLSKDSTADPLTVASSGASSRVILAWPNQMLYYNGITNKNTWSAGGVAVAEINSIGALVVRHGVSTDPTSVFKREPSVTRARDFMLTSCTRSLEAAGLIGSPLTADMPARIQSIIEGVLEKLVGVSTIIGYSGLAVQQISADPSVIEVQFMYRPTYPLNYVLLSFAIDTSTGDVTSTP
jgi:hypothetical protein